MRFYNVDHRGKHLLQRLNVPPAAEEGRIYFNSVVGGPFVSDGVDNHELVKADGGDYNIVAGEAKYS